MYTIYKITCVETGKAYYGKTKQTVQRRWINHVHYARHGEDTNLKRAIRKYGRKAFVIEEIAWAADNNKANWLETYFISFNDSVVSGYNSTYGGDGQSNPTEETLQKIREAGRRHKKHTPETIEKIRIVSTGRPYSLETRKKISRHAQERQDEKRGFSIDTNDLVPLYQQGFSHKTIADKFGISKQAVRIRLVKAGVASRPAGWSEKAWQASALKRTTIMANKGSENSSDQDKLIEQYPAQLDSYRVRGTYFPNKGGSGVGSKPGHDDLCPESGNQVGPRHAEDGGEGEGYGTPTEWQSGGRSPKVAAAFPVGKSKGEGEESATSVSIPEGVDLVSGKLTCSAYKETPVDETPEASVSIGRR